ncbi:IclR family transcriptional regulator [Rhodococcus koreensis]|uniref:Glycerol operon regulatory protein n=1 Tax=Rhodococcus koreensis TaxID=99653 RepID=A0A1H4KU62_9NOCA|nr:IclR family transcriptional regulator [Rhodococcus koreensis]SEB62074.1 DNA-binding transcriptional regulator, IclR family [Rhodococcus koreensis]
MAADNSGLQTVSRALAVLRCFQGDVELGVTDIARAQNLAMSTTHRLLRALLESEFVEQDEKTGRYRLGVALAEYGQLSYRRHLIYLAEPHIEQLAIETGTAVSIATRRGTDAINLAFTRWREAHGHNLSEVRFPLHASALGKALLAWSPTTSDELDTLPYHLGTDRTPQSTASLSAELEAARSAGYTINDEQTEWGFRIIAVPVLDPEGHARFALGMRGTTQLMIPERIPFLANLARVTAAAISDTLFETPTR